MERVSVVFEICLDSRLCLLSGPNLDLSFKNLFQQNSFFTNLYNECKLFVSDEFVPLTIHFRSLGMHTLALQKKMKFSIKDFFSKSDQIRRKLDLVTFTEEILNGKFQFFVKCNW